MALTIEQHKAAIDAAYPTPPIEWARQDDHVTFGHEDVATAELTFNRQSYHYLGSHYQEHGEEVWKIRRFLSDEEREAAIGGQVSWYDAKTAFESYWETVCEAQRELLAASAYGKDVVMTSPETFRWCGLSSCTLGRRRKRLSRSILASWMHGLSTPPLPSFRRLR